MPLKKCRECKKPVSVEAETCPHCGCPAPVKRERNRAGRRGCLLVLALLLLTAIASLCADDRDQPTGQATLNRGGAGGPARDDARIAALDAQARALPGSDIVGNLRLYKQLSELVPDNARYRQKVDYYQKQLTNQTAELIPTAPSLPAYSIIKDEKMGAMKRSLDVRLDQRVTQEDLAALARQLHKPGFERTFICYYLPGMTVGDGAWATTHFNPSLEVMILGATKERAEEMQASPAVESGVEHIGAWMFSGIVSRRVDIYKDESGYAIKIEYADGSGSNERASYKRVNGRMAYVEDTASYGEHYVVNARGQLEIWDQEGMIESGNSLK